MDLKFEYGADSSFTFTGLFDAPRELVFKAWTEAERLVKWWGPKGMSIRVAKVDLRPGGLFHYVMRRPDGTEMWARFLYLEIVAPERLVFLNSFSDEKGEIARAPFFDGGWPLEVHNTVTFAEEGGKTRLTLRGMPQEAGAEEIKTFAGNRDSMKGGFTGTMEQLEAYLKAAKS